MNESDYNSVVESNRLKNGKLFPIPITLDVDQKTADSWKVNDQVRLFDKTNNLIAILIIQSIWLPDKEKEARLVFSDDFSHPASTYLFNQAHSHYVGGKLIGFQLPIHHDFLQFRCKFEIIKIK